MKLPNMELSGKNSAKKKKKKKLMGKDCVFDYIFIYLFSMQCENH